MGDRAIGRGRSDDPEARLYVDEVKDKFKRLQGCCGTRCYAALKAAEVETHLQDLQFHKSVSYVHFWSWVRTMYFNQVALKKKGNQYERAKKVASFRLPAITYSICRKVFCVLLGITEKTLSSQMNKGIPRALAPFHGNANRVAHNALTDVQRQTAIDFILSLAAEEGIPNPRFAFSDDGGDDTVTELIHLPPHYSGHSLYYRYSALEFANPPPSEPLMGYVSFKKIFSNDPQVSHITLSKRVSGVCKRCKQLKNSLYASKDEATLAEKTEELRVHLRDAVYQRKVYTERVELAIKKWSDDANSNRLSIACISFDYASSAKLPSIVLEAQGDWMANRFGLDMRIFGVTNEGAKEYNAFFYNERFKHVDAESVISLLQRFFEKNPRVANARTLYVYSDSCSGQYRNRFMVAYWVTRVLDGFHERVSWNFLIVGHTKFSPDQLFGLLKTIFKKYDIIIPDEMVFRTVTGIVISQGSRSAEYKINAEEIKEEDVVFRQWKNLEAAFRSIPGIKKNPIAEARFDAVDVEGVRQVKVSYRLVNESAWTNVVILKRGMDWPQPGALSPSRQPEPVPWSQLGYSRWEKLNKYISDLSVDVREEHSNYYRDLPHHTTESSANRHDRAGNVVVEDPPAVAVPSVAPDAVVPPSDSDSEASMELEEVFGATDASEDPMEEAAKDNENDEISTEKRPRTPSPPPDPSPSSSSHSTPTRAHIIAALAPTSYEMSSRWNRSVPPPGAKRLRKMSKHGDV